MAMSMWQRIVKGDLVPENSKLIALLLIATSCVQSATLGYDGSMMNGLNILPSYTDYFHLNTATTSLNTAAMSIGGCLSFFYAPVANRIGRRWALFWTIILTMIACVIQTAAQNTAMFIVGRILIGLANGCSGLVGPVYVSETLPARWRGWGLGMYFDLWYVGGLTAAGITYATERMNSTWAWRLPSALQAFWSILALFILPFTPESPRWLAYHGRNDEAMHAIALTHANGDRNDPRVLAVYREIMDTQKWEKEIGQKLSFFECFKSKGNRRRMLLAQSVALFEALSGNAIATWYLGTMLDNAGITNTTTQLQINIILNAFCLLCAIGGTLCIDKVGRKRLALISTALCTLFMFLEGGLSLKYSGSGNTSGIYGTVACIFLFQGSYSIGWTPLTVTYPPEVLNYSIRASGMGVYQFLTFGAIVMTTFAYPFAMDAISWKLYMINGAWDVVEFIFVAVFWVETAGKTLEEIDAEFDGVKHSNVPDLEDIVNHKADIGDLLIDGIDPTMGRTTAPTTVPADAKEK